MIEWKMLPDEATAEMQKAASTKYPSCAYYAEDMYRAMVAAAPDPWQPIEEALKEDKVKLLLVFGPYVEIGYWSDKENLWMSKDEHYGMKYWVSNYQPTHWMPLPELPK